MRSGWITGERGDEDMIYKIGYRNNNYRKWTDPCRCDGSEHSLTAVCFGHAVLSGEYIRKPRNRFLAWLVCRFNGEK